MYSILMINVIPSYLFFFSAFCNYFKHFVYISVINELPSTPAVKNSMHQHYYHVVILIQKLNQVCTIPLVFVLELFCVCTVPQMYMCYFRMIFGIKVILHIEFVIIQSLHGSIICGVIVLYSSLIQFFKALRSWQEQCVDCYCTMQ